MDILHCAEMPWGESLVAQRGGGDVAHKRLFEGEEGTADNYMLVMAKEPNTYFSPRHRHPWDQIRFCLEGKIPIAKGLYVEGGEIAYFPESARYGPQEGGTNRIVLLLQFAGASGQSFIGPDKLKQARLELAQSGNFEGGVYTVETDSGKKNCDAYEAIWRHVKGGELSYAPAAYKTPIVMRPEALTWEATPETGVQVKRIGVFPHRGLGITNWKMAANAVHVIPSHPALRFIFVTAGNGTTNGTNNDETLRRWSAVRIQSGESVEIVAKDTLEFTEWVIEPVRGSNG
jgi:hypothetical protein